MITLINGRGQLGNSLQRFVENEMSTSENFFIYHTWNILDKSEELQKKCFDNFREFVDQNLNERIFFISTYSQTDNPYNHYKHLAEEYLRKNNPNGKSIRLPTLIGKGTCEGFLRGSNTPYGQMELLSVDDAATKIMEIIHSSEPYGLFRVYGDVISARLVNSLIIFGRDAKHEN